MHAGRIARPAHPIELRPIARRPIAGYPGYGRGYYRAARRATLRQSAQLPHMVPTATTTLAATMTATDNTFVRDNILISTEPNRSSGRWLWAAVLFSLRPISQLVSGRPQVVRWPERPTRGGFCDLALRTDIQF